MATTFWWGMEAAATPQQHPARSSGGMARSKLQRGAVCIELELALWGMEHVMATEEARRGMGARVGWGSCVA
jgi:hypothetical protein